MKSRHRPPLNLSDPEPIETDTASEPSPEGSQDAFAAPEPIDDPAAPPPLSERRRRRLLEEQRLADLRAARVEPDLKPSQSIEDHVEDPGLMTGPASESLLVSMPEFAESAEARPASR